MVRVPWPSKSTSALPAFTASTSPSPSKAPDPCEKPAAGKVKDLTFKKEPAITIDKTAKYTMDLRTTCGAIPITMDAAKAPHTVNSFNFLVNKGYLDHTKCHRLTTQGIYVLQCGDPTATGTGEDGSTETLKRSFRTQALTLNEQTYPSVSPLASDTVGVAMPIIVRFDLPVKNR